MLCRGITSSQPCPASGQQMGYDALRRLISWQNVPGTSPTASEQYAYDSEGTRVWQQATAVSGSSTTTTTTVYVLGVDELTTTSVTGQPAVTTNQRTYPLPGGHAVAVRDGSGLYELATDLLGTPLATLRLDDGTLVVVAVRSVPGAAAMWDLTVANVHTFAVGSGQFVVHNCARTVDGPGEPGTDANEFENRQGAELIKETPEFDRGFSSSYQWTYESAEKSLKPMENEIGHEARFFQRYYFRFWDEGAEVIREVSANFDPLAREWEEAAFHMSSGRY